MNELELADMNELELTNMNELELADMEDSQNDYDDDSATPEYNAGLLARLRVFEREVGIELESLKNLHQTREDCSSLSEEDEEVEYDFDTSRSIHEK